MLTWKWMQDIISMNLMTMMRKGSSEHPFICFPQSFDTHVVNKFTKMPLPRCYFDISINGIPTGRIVFELFSDICPRTCENFRSLCTGEKGEGKTTFKPLHYKGTLIHRIVKGFIVQGGDFENGDGSGGESIYGGFFKDENFKLKHESPFLLSMANKGTNTNGSQFFITTRSAAHLDGIHVVFGRVVSGMEFVTEIENQKVNSKNRPYADIRVSNCGELVLLKRGKAVKTRKTSKVTDSSSPGSGSDSSVDGSETDDSETERKKRKRRRREKRKKVSKQSRKDRKRKSKKRRKKKRESDSSSGEEDEEDAPPVVTSTITEDDLPPEISSTLNKKSWLYRYSKSPSPLDGEDATKKKRKREQFELNDRETKQSVIHVSGSGRVLKGRGNMRYRTPPPVQYGSRARYERSPDRDRYRNRSPDRDRYRNRSQDRDRHQRRSMDRDQRRKKSPDRDQYQSRSPDRDRYRKRSPNRDRYRSRSPDRDRYRKRSPNRDWYKQRSLDRDQRTPEKHENDSQPKGKGWLQEKSLDGSLIGKEQYREESSRYGQRSPGQGSHNGETTVSQDDSSNQRMPHKDLQKSTDQVKDSSKTVITEDRETSTPPLSPQDHTPPLYDERTEYWSNEAYRLVQESFNLADKTAPHTTTSASKWDKEDNNDGGCGQSDEDNELATAYQKVEQTLAEQQFGIGDLLDKHLKE